MGFAIAKALVLLLLSLLSLTVRSQKAAEPLPANPPLQHGSYHHSPTSAPVSEPPTHHHHHHAHPPSHAPTSAPTQHHHHHHHHAHPPTHAPVHAPAHAPAHPLVPTHPPTPPVVRPPTPPVVHPPTPPVVKPPTPPVVHPPPHPPAAPSPTHQFNRSFLAVQGVVYCKSCKYPGVETLLGATPVLGATVKLQCNNTKYPQEVKSTTDKNGYFLVKAPKTVTNYGYHRCKVWLVSAPNTACSKITDLHGGLSGATLRPEPKKNFYDEMHRPFSMFTVGPFAFEPKCPR